MKYWIVFILSICLTIQLTGQEWDKKTRGSSWFAENSTQVGCNLSWMDVELTLFVRYTTTISQSVQLRWWPKDNSQDCLDDKMINLFIDLELKYTDGKSELFQGQFKSLRIDPNKRFINIDNEFRYAHQEFWKLPDKTFLSPSELVTRFLSDGLIGIKILDVRFEDCPVEMFPDGTYGMETIGQGLVGFPCPVKCKDFIYSRYVSIDNTSENITLNMPLGEADLKYYKHPGPSFDQIYNTYVIGEKYTSKHVRRHVEHTQNEWKAATWLSMNPVTERSQVIRAYQLPENKGVLVFILRNPVADPEERLFLYENIFLKKLKLLK